MKNIIFYFLCFILFNKALGQSQQTIKSIDSTFITIINTPNTKKKVDQLTILFKKGRRRKYTNYKIIDSAINIANDLLYLKGLGKAYQEKGLSARYKYDYYTAIENHKKALSYLEKTTDTLELIKCLNCIGIAYRKVNIVDKSFNYYFRAYTLAEKFKMAASQAIALNGIGNIFIDTKKYNSALYYFKKALKLEVEANNKRGIEYDYANIGEAFLYLKNYDSAKIYTQKALDISLNNGKRDTEGAELSLFGKIYQKQREFTTSNSFYKRALDIFKRRKNKRYISNALINIGSNKIELKQSHQGITTVNEGLKIAEKIRSKENILMAYEILANHYSKTGKYHEALNAYKKATLFKDSIFNEISQKALISAQIAYETHLRDKKIKQLVIEKKKNKELAKKNNKRLIYSIVIGVIILLLLTIIFYLHRKNAKLKIENLNKKLHSYILELNNNDNDSGTSFEEKIEQFKLSERELQVLKLIIKGFSNSEISKQLFISNNTVKYHLKNIYSKMNVKNRIQIIKKVELIP